MKNMKETFPVIVDYSITLIKMIPAGKYDFVSSFIVPDCFPTEASGQIQLNIELLDYSIPMRCDDDIVKNMERRGLRPATLPELLAFGAAYPEMQKRFIIVALGSIWRALHADSRHIPCLFATNGKREIRLRPWNFDWEENCRFAAVRR